MDPLYREKQELTQRDRGEHRGHGEEISNYILSQQDLHGISSADQSAICGDYQKAVCARQCGYVSRTSPRQSFYFWSCAAPFDSGGEKVCQALLFFQRRAQPRFDEWQMARGCAAEQVDRGHYEQLERHHRGNRVAGKSEDESVSAFSEHGRPSGADRYGVEIKLRTQIFQHRFNQVVLPH